MLRLWSHCDGWLKIKFVICFLWIPFHCVCVTNYFYCQSARCAASLTFPFFVSLPLPSGSKGPGWSPAALLRVKWKLSDPSQTLESSQRAAVSPTVWPEPPSYHRHHHHDQCEPLSQAAGLSKSSFKPLSSVWNSDSNSVIYCTSVPLLKPLSIRFRPGKNTRFFAFPHISPEQCHTPQVRFPVCQKLGQDHRAQHQPTAPCPTCHAWMTDQRNSPNTQAFFHSPPTNPGA